MQMKGVSTGTASIALTFVGKADRWDAFGLNIPKQGECNCGLSAMFFISVGIEAIAMIPLPWFKWGMPCTLVIEAWDKVSAAVVCWCKFKWWCWILCLNLLAISHYVVFWKRMCKSTEDKPMKLIICCKYYLPVTYIIRTGI